MSNVFMHSTEQIVLALSVFVKGRHLELQFIKIGDKLRNQLAVPLLKIFNAYNKICSLDVSGELTFL